MIAAGPRLLAADWRILRIRSSTQSDIHKVPVDRIFFFFLKHLTKTPKIPKDWAKMDDDRGRGAGRLELNDSIVESISVNNCIEAAAHKKPKRKEKGMKETVM